jgi:hypothetical protein
MGDYLKIFLAAVVSATDIFGAVFIKNLGSDQASQLLSLNFLLLHIVCALACLIVFTFE